MSTVAVVIPCLNEAQNLELLLPRVFAVIERFSLPSRVYVVDGGSTDGTPETARRLGAEVIPQRGTGYGGAIKTAFDEIDATYLITLDADYSHHPAIIKYLYEVRDTANIVIASRYVAQGHAEMPWDRKILSGILNGVFRRILAIPAHDLSSGFRLYHRESVRRLNLEFSTYAVLQEILTKAYCEGYQVREIPFHYLPRRHGKTHAQLFRFGRDYLAALWRMRRLRSSLDSADYDNRAFHSPIPLQRWWQRRRYRIVLDYVGDSLRVLDCGCGSSQLLNGAPQVVGLDLARRKLRFMRRPGRRLVQGDALRLPFGDAMFEVAICSQVLEHLHEGDLALAELARVVQPGGSVVVGFVDYGGWQWPLIEKLYASVKRESYVRLRVRQWTRAEVESRLRDLGLVVEEAHTIAGSEIILRARKP